MRWVYLILIGGICFSAPLEAKGLKPWSSTQVKVIDGDSIVVGGREVRLEGIDAPEYHQDCYNAEGKAYACGVRAMEYMQNLTKDQKLRCEPIEIDRYKRVVAVCFAGKTDFVIDAIDTMRSKRDLLAYCYENNIPVITSLGAGNRFDPTKLYITDIKDIENKKCTFTKNVLYQLKKRGIEQGITAVCSNEAPIVREKIQNTENITAKNGEKFEFTKITPGSTPFVPAVAGYYLGWYVIKNLI